MFKGISVRWQSSSCDRERDQRAIAPRIVYRVYRTDRRDVYSDVLRQEWGLSIPFHDWPDNRRAFFSLASAKLTSFSLASLSLSPSLSPSASSLRYAPDALGFCSFSDTNACGFYLLLKARRGRAACDGCASACPFCCLPIKQRPRFLKTRPRCFSLHRAESIHTVAIGKILALHRLSANNYSYVSRLRYDQM